MENSKFDFFILNRIKQNYINIAHSEKAFYFYFPVHDVWSCNSPICPWNAEIGQLSYKIEFSRSWQCQKAV